MDITNDVGDLKHSINETFYDTHEEAFDEASPANFSPVEGQNISLNEPLIFDIKQGEASKSLPLCLVFNARSIFNKCTSMHELLHNYGPDFLIISETFERR